MPVTQSPCKCGSDLVSMVAVGGGRGCTDSTFYTGQCFACGYTLEHLPENSDGKRASAIRDWNRAVKKGVTQTRRRGRIAAPAPEAKLVAVARAVVSQAEVPPEYRSATPERLRAMAHADEVKMSPQWQKLLLDAAGEIEGSEQAYAVLVAEVSDLREKLARTEANLRATVAMVPHSPMFG